MIGVTFFGIFMTPVFYVLMRRVAGNRPLVQHHLEVEGGEVKVSATRSAEAASTRTS
jgi:multidrug efflux pump